MSLTTSSKQNGSIVSARKMKLRYDDDSDSDSEPTRRKHLDAVERRKSAAASENKALTKPPASSKSVPQLAIGRAAQAPAQSARALDNSVDYSTRSTRGDSTQRGDLSARVAPSTARSMPSTFSTPRLDATSTEMRRVMTFDEDSEDEGADRIIKAASTRLQLGSSVKRVVRGGGDTKSGPPSTPEPPSQKVAHDEDTKKHEKPHDAQTNGHANHNGHSIVAHTTPSLQTLYLQSTSSHKTSKANQSRLEQVIGHVSDDEDAAPVAHTIFKKKQPPEQPDPNLLLHDPLEEHKLQIEDTFQSQHAAIDFVQHEVYLLQREMRNQHLQHRQIVKAFEDMKRSMAEEIHLLKSEVRSLKAKLTDDENSIPARIKQAERAAEPWDRYRSSRAPSPRRISGTLGR